MDKFQKKFLVEAGEHIQNIEEALLELDKSPENSDLIEQTFRAMHTLKGGGAMFGFNQISDLTHNLETIFDHLRSGKVKLTNDILTISFDAVDQLKILVNDDTNSSHEVSLKQEKLLQRIDHLNNSIETKKDEENVNDSSVDDHNEGTIDTYYICFKPHSEIFDNGTNPLFIIDELTSSGEFICIPRLNKIPEFNKLEPTRCYVWWEIFIATNKSSEEIHDAFMFVEEDSDITIQKIASNDIISLTDFKETILRQAEEKEEIDLGVLTKFINISSSEDENKKITSDSSLLNQKIRGSKIFSIRVDSEKIDQFMNLVSELVTTQASLALYTNKEKRSELEQINENMQKLTRDLRDLAFNIALIPIDQIVTRFQRLVRDLSKELHKEIDFLVEGTETELDKNIIESLTDPILHILRNAVDHGIESPEERKKLGKPEKGKIQFKAYYSGANVHIQIHDDGKGMDTNEIKQKAIENNLISPDAVLSKKEILDLTFLPGFSTSHDVTGISGRGVGMDVVKRKISEIRGSVEIDSEKNVGTTITIKLPLTLSIVDGLLVGVDDEKYLIPLSAIEKIYPVEHDILKNNFHKVIELDEKLIPFFYLRKEFDTKEGEIKNEHAIVISYEDNQVALIVDQVIGEYQAVLKTLGKHYKKQEMVSGATILGDGSVALVLDTNMMVTNFCRKTELVEN